MERDQAIAKLISYALDKELIQPEEKIWAVNALLEALELDGCTLPEEAACGEEELPQVLDALLDDAYARGVLKENSIVYRDLFDTKLMGALTPRPAQVIEKFQSLREQDPKKATDWYYRFSQDTNYIRRDRIAKDVQWKTETEYGELDITINLSKPEKDPKAIAAARNLPASNYPRCQLCAENEGYAGRVNHPARQNHRIVPITINNSPWFLQYSPYVYYNEHCICLNREHVPMKIDRSCFAKLLDFVGQFPHYFVGSNASWAAPSWPTTTSRAGGTPSPWRKPWWRPPSPSRDMRTSGRASSSGPCRSSASPPPSRTGWWTWPTAFSPPGGAIPTRVP